MVSIFSIAVFNIDGNTSFGMPDTVECILICTDAICCTRPNIRSLRWDAKLSPIRIERSAKPVLLEVGILSKLCCKLSKYSFEVCLKTFVLALVIFLETR